MTSNNRFDAALRAHAFHRSFGEGEHPEEAPPEPSVAEPPLPDFAAELEASLMRDLNALTVGLRPPPRKLLPDRAPDAAPTAVVAKPVSPIAAPPLPPATWPVAPGAGMVSPYAPPPKLPPASWPTASPSLSTGPAAQVGEKPPSPYAPQAKRPAPDPLPTTPLAGRE